MEQKKTRNILQFEKFMEQAGFEMAEISEKGCSILCEDKEKRVELTVAIRTEMEETATVKSMKSGKIVIEFIGAPRFRALEDTINGYLHAQRRKEEVVTKDEMKKRAGNVLREESEDSLQARLIQHGIIKSNKITKDAMKAYATEVAFYR